MRRALLAALLALLVGTLAFVAAAPRVPDLEMRSVPWLTHLGATQADHPPGQRLRCARDGLHRIDVGVNRLGETPPSVLELVLREGGPDGPILRRALGSTYEQGEQRSWIGFDLEPLPDSAGRDLHLTLLPSGEARTTWVGAWARPRGNADPYRGWGDPLETGARFEGRFLCRQRDLRGLAFAFRGAEGPVGLVLRDATTGEELRRAQRVAHTLEGWVTLSFPMLPESRWRELSYELTLPEGAQLRGVDGEPGLVGFHGSGAVDPRLGGMTLGGETLADCDLVLRVWTSSSPAAMLALLRERLGWRLVPALVLWLAASAVLASVLPRARG